VKSEKIEQHMQDAKSGSRNNLGIENQTDLQHICYSPAKVNLFLKVLSKRDDGYHNIVSIVSPVSLYDVIYFENRDDGKITVKDNKNCLPEGQAYIKWRCC
jgi:4-diphosphocytidyl-2C-methyl-D-erythritol kinase